MAHSHKELLDLLAHRSTEVLQRVHEEQQWCSGKSRMRCSHCCVDRNEDLLFAITREMQQSVKLIPADVVLKPADNLDVLRSFRRAQLLPGISRLLNEVPLEMAPCS